MTVDRVISALGDKKKSRLVKMSSPKTLSRVDEFVPTGCLPLDIIMGGGVPIGRSMEIYGDTSTGKSLLAAHIIAETQAMGGTPVLIDTETATSEDIMQAVGIDPDEVIYDTPDVIEEVYEDISQALEAKKKADPKGLMVIVWDSVASTSSDAEVAKILKEGLSGSTMATHARLLSTMCRVIPRMIARDRVGMVFINQTRENIGVMYGDKMTTFGGRAIGYYASVRLEMAKTGVIEGDGDQPIGIDVRCRVSKSKVSAPFGVCRFPILFGVGIDKPGAMLYWAKDKGLVESKGSRWGWKGLSLPSFLSKDWADYYANHQRDIDGYALAQAGFEGG